uniref:nucleotidyltransferase domain-containing protein n=1 Tax=Candidatus Electronema sp. TaxID=2698783 RepID=UPI004055C2CA
MRQTAQLTRRRLLALCACDAAEQETLVRLERAAAAFRQTADDADWNLLLHEAEREGMAPLLHKHLGAVGWGGGAPEPFRRALQSLRLRSRHASGIRSRAAAEIISTCAAEGIDLLAVKGIALAGAVYSEPGLRPMRDIDLLLRHEDAARAEALLLSLGWQQEAGHDIPPDYYHLPPLVKTMDGLPVTVELHRNLLPLHARCPRWPLEKSWPSSRPVAIGGAACRTLSWEDTLRSVYLHGFQAPLSYEPFRLIHAADLVTLAAKFLDEIDWEQARAEEPALSAALSRLHFLTPLPDRVISRLRLDISRKPAGIGLPYSGWPLRKLAETRRSGLLRLALDTIWPPEWWLQVYHGHLSGLPYWRARLIEHPRMVWRWFKDCRRARLKK